MSDLLKAKTVVVTGAPSAIGRAIALKAAEHGAKAVIISDVTETPREGGEPTVDEIKKLGVQSLFVKTDVSKRAENDAFIEAPSAFGGVDVMVASTGITFGL
jgi:NAD(P)-dependent dehydrogenase (short-subunit alcohol dehydrogenase family)